jgi:Uma2 family endonuclease
MNMGIHEIALPKNKPDIEWVRGRPLRKTGGAFTHAVLQCELAALLRAWAREHGKVGISCRFRVAPAGEVFRPLAPDIAYVHAERLRDLQGNDLDSPPLAPDIVAEILMPEDRRIDLDHKIDVYLRAGCFLAIIVDPKRRVVELHDAKGCHELRERDAIEHPAMPGFAHGVDALFAAIAPLA